MVEWLWLRLKVNIYEFSFDQYIDDDSADYEFAD